jgi:hypothetical protein
VKDCGGHPLARFPHRNKTEHKSWQEYYTQELAGIVTAKQWWLIENDYYKEWKP